VHISIKKFVKKTKNEKKEARWTGGAVAWRDRARAELVFPEEPQVTKSRNWTGGTLLTHRAFDWIGSVRKFRLRRPWIHHFFGPLLSLGWRGGRVFVCALDFFYLFIHDFLKINSGFKNLQK
jgi:hypothetical protein